MKYLEYMNKLIKDNVRTAENCVLFGQNINAGSCLGGLTKNITLSGNSRILNTTNAENSLVGFGFGLMMNGSSGVFLMKQLDFLLLGIDHLVNTYNIIRSIKDNYPNGSFTIIATIVDSGYDGPQSSFNNFYDLCAIARVDGFNVNNKADADHLFTNEFLQPGFRIIALSQRLSREELNETSVPIKKLANGNIFQYSEGDDATIVSLNFSLPQALLLAEYLAEKNIQTTHYQINNITNSNWEEIIQNVSITKKIIIIDDSKSMLTSADQLLAELCGMHIQKIIIKRDLKDNWLYPVSDHFEINHEKILNLINSINK